MTVEPRLAGMGYVAYPLSNMTLEQAISVHHYIFQIESLQLRNNNPMRLLSFHIKEISDSQKVMT